MNQEKIGKFILENRKKKNLTQNELSKKLKVSNHTISNWENGKSMPNYDLLIPLTKELGISISELINGEYQSNIEAPNKVVEKTIKFLRQIDKDRKKKYRNIGIMLIVVGFLIKFLSMLLLPRGIYYGTHYVILAYIITIIGISNLFHEEKVKHILLKTISGAIITLLLFISIDIAEIKILNVPPRYPITSGRHYTLEYHQTPFYDVYRCFKNDFGGNDIKKDYTIIFKKDKIKLGNFIFDMKQLEEKYCKNK